METPLTQGYGYKTLNSDMSEGEKAPKSSLDTGLWLPWWRDRHQRYPHCLRLLDSPSFILPSAISALVHVMVKAFRPYEGCGLVMENLDIFGFVRMYVHLACVYSGVGMCV